MSERIEAAAKAPFKQEWARSKNTELVVNGERKIVTTYTHGKHTLTVTRGEGILPSVLTDKTGFLLMVNPQTKLDLVETNNANIRIHPFIDAAPVIGTNRIEFQPPRPLQPEIVVTNGSLSVEKGNITIHGAEQVTARGENNGTVVRKASFIIDGKVKHLRSLGDTNIRTADKLADQAKYVTNLEFTKGDRWNGVPLKTGWGEVAYKLFMSQRMPEVGLPEVTAEHQLDSQGRTVLTLGQSPLLSELTVPQGMNANTEAVKIVSNMHVVDGARGVGSKVGSALVSGSKSEFIATESVGRLELIKGSADVARLLSSADVSEGATFKAIQVDGQVTAEGKAMHRTTVAIKRLGKNGVANLGAFTDASIQTGHITVTGKEVVVNGVAIADQGEYFAIGNDVLQGTVQETPEALRKDTLNNPVFWEGDNTRPVVEADIIDADQRRRIALGADALWGVFARENTTVYALDTIAERSNSWDGGVSFVKSVVEGFAKGKESKLVASDTITKLHLVEGGYAESDVLLKKAIVDESSFKVNQVQGEIQAKGSKKNKAKLEIGTVAEEGKVNLTGNVDLTIQNGYIFVTGENNHINGELVAARKHLVIDGVIQPEYREKLHAVDGEVKVALTVGIAHATGGVLIVDSAQNGWATRGKLIVKESLGGGQLSGDASLEAQRLTGKLFVEGFSSKNPATLKLDTITNEANLILQRNARATIQNGPFTVMGEKVMVNGKWREPGSWIAENGKIRPADGDYVESTPYEVPVWRGPLHPARTEQLLVQTELAVDGEVNPDYVDINSERRSLATQNEHVDGYAKTLLFIAKTAAEDILGISKRRRRKEAKARDASTVIEEGVANDTIVIGSAQKERESSTSLTRYETIKPFKVQEVRKGDSADTFNVSYAVSAYQFSLMQKGDRELPVVHRSSTGENPRNVSLNGVDQLVGLRAPENIIINAIGVEHIDRIDAVNSGRIVATNADTTVVRGARSKVTLEKATHGWATGGGMLEVGTLHEGHVFGNSFIMAGTLTGKAIVEGYSPSMKASIIVDTVAEGGIVELSTNAAAFINNGRIRVRERMVAIDVAGEHAENLTTNREQVAITPVRSVINGMVVELGEYMVVNGVVQPFVA